jgi:hypothetical protein
MGAVLYCACKQLTDSYYSCLPTCRTCTTDNTTDNKTDNKTDDSAGFLRSGTLPSSPANAAAVGSAMAHFSGGTGVCYANNLSIFHSIYFSTI